MICYERVQRRTRQSRQSVFTRSTWSFITTISTSWSNIARYSNKIAASHLILRLQSHLYQTPRESVYVRHYVAIILLATDGPFCQYLSWTFPHLWKTLTMFKPCQTNTTTPTRSSPKICDHGHSSPDTKKMISSNHSIVSISGRYDKLIRATPSGNITAAHVAEVFIDAWVMLYGIFERFPIRIGPTLVGKVFDAICTVLGSRY